MTWYDRMLPVVSHVPLFKADCKTFLPQTTAMAEFALACAHKRLTHSRMLCEEVSGIPPIHHLQQSFKPMVITVVRPDSCFVFDFDFFSCEPRAALRALPGKFFQRRIEIRIDSLPPLRFEKTQSNAASQRRQSLRRMEDSHPEESVEDRTCAVRPSFALRQYPAGY